VTLIFLASVALLEFMLSRPEEAGREEPGAASEKPDNAISISSNLHNLGNVLEGYGRGAPAEKEIAAGQDTPTAQDTRDAARIANTRGGTD